MLSLNIFTIVDVGLCCWCFSGYARVQLESTGRSDRHHVGGRHRPGRIPVRHHSHQSDHHPRHARPQDRARFVTLRFDTIRYDTMSYINVHSASLRCRRRSQAQCAVALRAANWTAQSFYASRPPVLVLHLASRRTHSTCWSRARGIDHVGWALDPLRICRICRVCFDP